MLIALIVFAIVLFPISAKAVMPPDFIFNVTTQVIQFFSIATLVLGTLFTSIHQFIKVKFINFKLSKLLVIGSIAGIIVMSVGGALIYGKVLQKKEYNDWVKEAEIKEEKANSAEFVADAQPAIDDSLDKLKIDQNTDVDKSSQRFVSNISDADKDANTLFISNYYSNIAEGKLDLAYAVSLKNADFATYQSWYNKITKISLDSYVKIDSSSSSLQLTLFEGETYTKYALLLGLKMEDQKPISISKSQVRVLSEGNTNSQNASTEKVKAEYSFFEKNKDAADLITNEQFKDVTNSNRTDYIVLDARENLEFDNGNFPGSTHIRFADLLAGRWVEIPNDKFVYVFCWSGGRGSEVAKFLRTKNIVSSYVKDGAKGWVEFGGKWNGNYLFNQQYKDKEFFEALSTERVKKEVQDGAILVDCREPSRYQKSHIPDSINISTIYTPTIKIEELYSQVPQNSKIIDICDGWVNCFDAKVTAVELIKRGHTYLGPYNKPWEYGK